ncbi:isochorismatase family protein [Yinghuangia seranimata]|uniref:isochorismatase family protein n=1 Tax=Yinghuangia seranimata TaxID=408067 RepID=UPI00248AAD8E|nr:isochorismatase family protein [Yinghuangia seranimata]MDI2130902.1 isochorismatase family protein [Yinghuangia seranimata]
MSTANPSATLRDVIGLDNRPPRLSDATLVLIDMQNTYRQGVMALDGAEEAVAAAAALLARARDAGARVIHVAHDGGPGSPYDIRAEIGRISDEVAPVEGEPTVVKAFPNSFHMTELEQLLRGTGADELVLAGFMTHMCVQFTAQGAFNLGFRPTVVAEATATRTLTAPDGSTVPSSALQAAALTTITDIFGTVVPRAGDLPD